MSNKPPEPQIGIDDGRGQVKSTGKPNATVCYTPHCLTPFTWHVFSKSRLCAELAAFYVLSLTLKVRSSGRLAFISRVTK